jgi:site-specific DNA recombinase
MYSNVNRKKKTDGTYYKDFFYYACKHRLKVDGHNCGYHQQWGQNKVNVAVEEVIYKLVVERRILSGTDDTFFSGISA